MHSQVKVNEVFVIDRETNPGGQPRLRSVHE